MKKFYLKILLVAAIDRVLKILVQLFLGSKEIFLIKNFFYLIYVKNIGAAFSILEGKQFLLEFVAVFAIIMLIWYVKKNNIKFIGYPILIGGIIGNLIDRIIYGYVIDFIGFELFSYKMPIFNFADIAIVIGAIMIIVGSDKKNEDDI